CSRSTPWPPSARGAPTWSPPQRPGTGSRSSWPASWRSLSSARLRPASGATWPGRATPPSPLAERRLDRAGQEAPDAVALEREEDDQRDRQRDERRRGDQVDVRAELAQLGEDRDRDRLGVAAEGERDQEVVPRPEELEDRERGDRRQPERQDDAGEDAE